MKVYNNPRKIKWEKHRDEEIKDKVKKNSPKSTKHITSEGEKIIYIPYDSDYHRELENEHKERKVNTLIIPLFLNAQKIDTSYHNNKLLLLYCN